MIYPGRFNVLFCYHVPVGEEGIPPPKKNKYTTVRNRKPQFRLVGGPVVFVTRSNGQTT